MGRPLWQMGLAVLSLVLFCGAVALAVAGDLVFGSVALVAALLAAVRAIREMPTGRWRDGIALGIAWLLFGFVAGSLTASRPFSRRIPCLSYVKQQVLGMVMYAEENDEHFPLASTWHTATLPYSKNEFHCPQATSPWSYAMNGAQSGADGAGLSPPSDRVLLFEGDARLPNASGGREWLVFRHSKTTTIGYTDGHAKMLKAAAADALSWK